MTTMTSAAARALWRALVDNAASLVVDAHTLYPTSPARAQALIVLAQEELGKSEWVFEACWDKWESGSDEPITIRRLSEHARSHIEKFATADEAAEWIRFHWTTPPGAELGEPVAVTEEEIRDRYRTYAREADVDKQNGFYVDLRADGTLSVPKEIERPYLADEIVIAAQLCLQVLVADAWLVDYNLNCMPDMIETYRRIEPISTSRRPPWGNR